MAVRPIRILGDPVLRMQCRRVETITPGIEDLVSDMADTMYNAPGVGLAASQIGVPKRVIVFDVGEGLQVIINPEVVREEDNEESIEGCLSVPNTEQLIKRPQLIEVRGIDKQGRESTFVFEGLPARVVLHEIDHLQGKLIVDQGKPVLKKEAEES